VLRPVAPGRPCYPELDYPAFANLFLFNALNLERTQDDAGRVADELAAADRLLGVSRLAFRHHRYLAAAFAAKAAYQLVRKGARQAGVPVVGSTEGWQVDEPVSGAAAAAKVGEGVTVDHIGPHSHRLRD
jgi:hypothetical protein